MRSSFLLEFFFGGELGSKFGVVFSICAALFIAACGGGNNATTPPSTITVSITPSSTTLLLNAATKLQATVTGSADPGVTFTVLEANGGQVTNTGDYTAPASPGTYHVRATSVAAPAKFADATITVRDYNNTITRITNAADARDYHTASLLSDGSVLLVGGFGFSGTQKTAERYIPSQDKFQPSATLASARIQHNAIVLPSGKVLVTGGYDPAAGGTPFDPAFRSTEIYDRAGDVFAAGADMKYPRRQHEATLLKDGRVFISGGIQLIGSGFGASTNTEIYDPAANTFTDANPMTVGRYMHSATLLNDGRVLIVGGRDNNCTGTCAYHSLSSAEIFDPATGAHTATGSLHLSRYAHTATLLPDGRVLVLGGETTDLPTTDQIQTGEVFDPATGQFTVFGSMLGARSYHTMTRLNSGKYLLAGGKNFFGSIVGTTEVFDATTGTSVAGPDMNDWRYRHTATRLLSGEVLIVGGNNSGGPVVPIDIFR